VGLAKRILVESLFFCLATGLIYASPKKNLHQDKSDVGRQTKTKNDKNKRV